jgi:hypothetical protein
MEIQEEEYGLDGGLGIPLFPFFSLNKLNIKST